jgi:hypothetical protein
MIVLNASQVDTLIGSRPDTPWRGQNFWKYWSRLCRLNHNHCLPKVYTPVCSDCIDYGEYDDGYTDTDCGRRISCCERLSRWFVDTYRWLVYGKTERNVARGRDDECGNFELLKEYWHPIRACEKRRKVVIEGVELVGIPDGVRVSDGTLIEIKSRRNRLFECVPHYEMAQLYIYMWLFDKCEIKQIQFYQNKFRVHNIKFNEQVWKQMVVKFHKVKDAIEHFRNNPSDRGKYLSRPQEFLDEYMTKIS